MFERISNSWVLVKASWAVLRADRELIVFPIVSVIGALVVTVTFIAPMAWTGSLPGQSGGGQTGETSLAVFGFLFYLVQYTVIFFCNSALVGAVTIRLEGGDPSLQDGFRIASKHFGSIVGYALIAATVGMLLRALRERGFLGQIAAGLFGLAWNIATFLVVPILVVEGVGPLEAVKRSTQLLKRTWGEQIVGNFGIGAVFGLLSFVVILLGFPLITFASSSNSVSLVLAAVLVVTLALVTLGLISSALSGIYTAAVYRYAAYGEVGNYFSLGLVQSSFRAK